MLELSAELRERLSAVREELVAAHRALPEKGVLREWIERENVGRFIKLTKMEQREIRAFLQGRTVAGVDGSTATFGGTFPGLMTLMQAVALTMDRRRTFRADVVSPMAASDLRRLQRYIEEKGIELSAEEAYNKWRDERLACLEVEAALALLKEGGPPPRLVMFDGGFLRYEKRAFGLWEEYAGLADALGVLSVGVIEEVGTYFLSKALSGRFGQGRLPYDRQLLFGVLEPGELLVLHPAKGSKGSGRAYVTCFARLSRHPAIIGCDFFLEQREELENVVRYLYANASESGRGIPFWIDRVDEETKLSLREVEAMVTASLPAGLIEKYFVSQRSRRDL
ncbi:hypothetical protein BSNK01_08150 [Bacillaceae bacterium]